MTALKKTVRTRRGVEPAGRPARREVELGKKSTNELVQDATSSERSIRVACRSLRAAMIQVPRAIVGRRARAVGRRSDPTIASARQ